MLEGLQGTIGKMVFRQLFGKTIVSARASRPSRQSKQQRENRIRFQSASLWAKKQLQDPAKKAYYQQQAKELNLPNAYTAAIGEYMRNTKPAAPLVQINQSDRFDEI
jgi:hypothetical protein